MPDNWNLLLINFQGTYKNLYFKFINESVKVKSDDNPSNNPCLYLNIYEENDKIVDNS